MAARVTEKEVDLLLEDERKVIDVDVVWQQDQHYPWMKFKAPVDSDEGYPLTVIGSWNPLTDKVSFVLLFLGLRIYALDMGSDHHNPTCQNAGDPHKHRWKDGFRDKDAYKPTDITAPVSDVPALWRQFCAEAKINHRGHMPSPPAYQLRLI